MLLVVVLLLQLHYVISEDLLHHSPLGLGVKRLQKKFSGRIKAPTASCGNSIEYYYSDAILDHFESTNNLKHWYNGVGQRYWVNEELWGGPGSPIFVFIGGEGQESCSRLSNYLYFYTLASEHNALLVDIEHRYYGESYPTIDMSTENLSKYLSADQALADLAVLIGHIKTSFKTDDSKVITFGGSYPGNLAAWFRLKYPSVTHGSVASSAPLKAKLNFYEYMEVVGRAILYFSGEQCYDAMSQAANQIAKLASQGPGSAGMKQIESDFNTCSAIIDEKDLGILYSDLMGNVQGTVQYNNEGSSLNVNAICSIMTETQDSYSQFVKLSATYRDYYGLSCEDANWNDVMAYLSASSKDPTNAARPWTFQTCNEFGYYQTTDSQHQPFTAWKELNLNFSREICAAAFDGWSVDPNTQWINQEYGSVNIAGTNIVFPSGTIDPWHALGVTNATVLPQDSEKVDFILGTAHCKDMYNPSASDPESLTFARGVIADNVAAWVQQ